MPPKNEEGFSPGWGRSKRVRKPNSIYMSDVKVGDIIRIEVDPYGRSYGEPNEYTLLVTKLVSEESNTFNPGYSIEGFEMKTEKKEQIWYRPSNHEIFMVAKCDSPSKK